MVDEHHDIVNLIKPQDLADRDHVGLIAHRDGYARDPHAQPVRCDSQATVSRNPCPMDTGLTSGNSRLSSDLSAWEWRTSPVRLAT